VHGAKNWVAPQLVPENEWKSRVGLDVRLGPKYRANRHVAATGVEDIAGAVGAMEARDKNWVAVAALVPGRTNVQCRFRWRRS
jgi:hypothetical protein